CDTVAFVGFDGGTVGAIAHHVLHIPSTSYQHIEDVHLTLCHVITNALQDRARDDEELTATGLEAEVQERVRRINYVRQQLIAEPSPQRRVVMIPDQIRRTIGFDRAMIFMAEGGELVLRGTYGAPREDARLDIEADLAECEAFRARTAIAVTEVNGHAPVWLGAYKDVTSYAVVPIVRDDESVGVLVGGFTKTDRVAGARELQLLQIFAYNVRSVLVDRPEPNPAPWFTED
ncbi:MAG: GAF domain-containing protein, partial [Actinobacteria bacterium]|nr:GAF domain-containing protein [Actinomycetota bacterium]